MYKIVDRSGLLSRTADADMVFCKYLKNKRLFRNIYLELDKKSLKMHKIQAGEQEKHCI